MPLESRTCSAARNQFPLFVPEVLRQTPVAMAVGRNDPCPCGSGKKYKKCCLAKNEAEARAREVANRRAADEQRQAEEAAEAARQEAADREWKARREAQRTTLPPDAPEATRRREPDWPPLAAGDQAVVDAWWNEVEPVYMGRLRAQQCGWLLQHTLRFLDDQPRLFRYLYLHEEFLFELDGMLAEQGRHEDYLDLLRRLRREQPEMYFQCFGYYDRDLLTEALRCGQREDIPNCLNLFREHPIRHIDEFAKVVDLLAWHGCAAELKALLEPTAITIAESPEVIAGDFGLHWLTNLAIFSHLESGDASPAALDRLWQDTIAVGLLDEKSPKNREWLRRVLQMTLPSTAEAQLDLHPSEDEWHACDVSWSFTGWARRTKGLAWASARFLAEALVNYWAWKDDEKPRRKKPFGLVAGRLDRYLMSRCRDILGLNGLAAMSMLQAFHFFTEYLSDRGFLATDEVTRMQTAAAGFFEPVQKMCDTSDAACRLYPTWDALIAGPPREDRPTAPL